MLAILGMLAAVALEQLPRRHAHDAGCDPLGLEPPMRLDAQRHFAAGREQQHVGPPVGCIQQHVGAALQPVGRRTPRAIERRDRLPRQDQRPPARGGAA